MKTIVLISCVSKKLPCTAKVKDLYISNLFKLSLQYAKSLDPDVIYILSAKYGLTPLDSEIEPYEKTLNRMSARENKLWAIKVSTIFIISRLNSYRKTLAYLKANYMD